MKRDPELETRVEQLYLPPAGFIFEGVRQGSIW